MRGWLSSLNQKLVLLMDNFSADTIQLADVVSLLLSAGLVFLPNNTNESDSSSRRSFKRTTSLFRSISWTFAERFLIANLVSIAVDSSSYLICIFFSWIVL